MSTSVTTVVNVRHAHAGSYVYVGRAGRGQAGTFGNPFRRSDPNCLEKFRAYFIDRMKNDRRFASEVIALRGKALGCFCVRRDGSGECHAKIIAEYLNNAPMYSDASGYKAETFPEWAAVNAKIRGAVKAAMDPATPRLLETNHFVDVPGLECPECGGAVLLAIEAWDPETGEPHSWAFQCAQEDPDGDPEITGGAHRYYQSDWQEIRDRAEAWGRTQGFRVPLKESDRG